MPICPALSLGGLGLDLPDKGVGGPEPGSSKCHEVVFAADDLGFLGPGIPSPLSRKPQKGDNDNFCLHLWELWMPHLKYLLHCGRKKRDNTRAIKMLHQISV